MKYELISFNAHSYNEEVIQQEINKYMKKKKNAKIIAMNTLPNNWIRFLIEIN